MDEKEYVAELKKIRQSRLNNITHMVNCQVPKEKSGLKNEVEEMYYDELVKEADEWEKRGGVRPIFEMGEIEYDDPVLDIYKDPVK